MSEKKLYKVLVNGVSCKGGNYEYDLPKQKKDGTWKPGKWTKKIPKNELAMCSKGYHLTTNPKGWLSNGCRVFLAEARDISGWDGDKCVCSQARLLMEFETNTGEENTGPYNSGDRNSGDRNSGYRNSGDSNSGDRNSGDSNSGNRNSGDSNSGDRNSGDSNSGNRNSGDSNSGNRNSGDSNSGNRNSGDSNSGNRNSGDSNSGNWNSGYSNSGNRNSGDSNSGNWNSGFLHTGAFNTGEPKKIYLFNKLMSYKQYKKISFPNYFRFDLTEWVNYTEDDKHKQATQGYLKTYEYKEAWKNSFKKASRQEVEQTIKLPHFDYKVFHKITGITKNMIMKRLKEA